MAYIGLKQLEDKINKIEEGMTEDLLHTTKEGIISELTDRISEIRMEAKFDHQFVFDDTELKRALTVLGGFEKYPRHCSEKEFAKSGFEYELKNSGKFSVNEELRLIALNNRNERNINYFDITSGNVFLRLNLILIHQPTQSK